MKWIYRLYILFVGIILTTTVGFGIAAFYPQPSAPPYPSSPYTKPLPVSCSATPESQSSPECQKYFAEQEQNLVNERQSQADYQEQIKTYSNRNASYTRTTIFLGIAIGALFAIVGLSLIRFSHPIANGVMLAGVLTAILTRLIISLASLGSSVTSTSGADTMSYVEFAVLIVLSVAVIVLGFTTLAKIDKPAPVNTV